MNAATESRIARNIPGVEWSDDANSWEFPDELARLTFEVERWRAGISSKPLDEYLDEDVPELIVTDFSERPEYNEILLEDADEQRYQIRLGGGAVEIERS